MLGLARVHWASLTIMQVVSKPDKQIRKPTHLCEEGKANSQAKEAGKSTKLIKMRAEMERRLRAW